MRKDSNGGILLRWHTATGTQGTEKLVFCSAVVHSHPWAHQILNSTPILTVSSKLAHKCSIPHIYFDPVCPIAHGDNNEANLVPFWQDLSEDAVCTSQFNTI